MEVQTSRHLNHIQYKVYENNNKNEVNQNNEKICIICKVFLNHLYLYVNVYCDNKYNNFTKWLAINFRSFILELYQNKIKCVFPNLLKNNLKIYTYSDTKFLTIKLHILLYLFYFNIIKKIIAQNILLYFLQIYQIIFIFISQYAYRILLYSNSNNIISNYLNGTKIIFINKNINTTKLLDSIILNKSYNNNVSKNNKLLCAKKIKQQNGYHNINFGIAKTHPSQHQYNITHRKKAKFYLSTISSQNFKTRTCSSNESNTQANCSNKSENSSQTSSPNCGSNQIANNNGNNNNGGNNNGSNNNGRNNNGRNNNGNNSGEDEDEDEDKTWDKRSNDIYDEDEKDENMYNKNKERKKKIYKIKQINSKDENNLINNTQESNCIPNESDLCNKVCSGSDTAKEINQNNQSHNQIEKKYIYLKKKKRLLKNLSFVSFNAGLLEYKIWGMCVYQNPPFILNRLLHMPHELIKTNTDIIALQEVYNDEHIEYLINNLKSTYPFYAKGYYCNPIFEKEFMNSDNLSEYEDVDKVRKNEIKSISQKNSKKSMRKKYFALNHGLLVFSKYPIIYSCFHKFKDVTYIEYLFGTKGFLEVVIDVPYFGRIALFNIHLASGSTNTESKYIENIRDYEIKQIIQTARKAQKKNTIPIIIGDLNASPHSSPNNYSSFVKHGWKDAWLYARNIKKKIHTTSKNKKSCKNEDNECMFLKTSLSQPSNVSKQIIQNTNDINENSTLFNTNADKSQIEVSLDMKDGYTINTANVNNQNSYLNINMEREKGITIEDAAQNNIININEFKYDLKFSSSDQVTNYSHENRSSYHKMADTNDEMYFRNFSNSNTNNSLKIFCKNNKSLQNLTSFEYYKNSENKIENNKLSISNIHLDDINSNLTFIDENKLFSNSSIFSRSNIFSNQYNNTFEQIPSKLYLSNEFECSNIKTKNISQNYSMCETVNYDDKYVTSFICDHPNNFSKQNNRSYSNIYQNYISSYTRKKRGSSFAGISEIYNYKLSSSINYYKDMSMSKSFINCNNNSSKLSSSSEYSYIDIYDMEGSEIKIFYNSDENWGLKKRRNNNIRKVKASKVNFKLYKHSQYQLNSNSMNCQTKWASFRFKPRFLKISKAEMNKRNQLAKMHNKLKQIRKKTKYCVIIKNKKQHKSVRYKTKNMVYLNKRATGKECLNNRMKRKKNNIKRKFKNRNTYNNVTRMVSNKNTHKKISKILLLFFLKKLKYKTIKRVIKKLFGFEKERNEDTTEDQHLLYYNLNDLGGNNYMGDKQKFLDILFNNIREKNKKNTNTKNLYKTKNSFLNLSSSKKCHTSNENNQNEIYNLLQTFQTDESILNDEITWDPRNPLNIIGPHSSCSALRCDYIFFPPINRNVWNTCFSNDSNKNDQNETEKIRKSTGTLFNSKNDDNLPYEQCDFPLSVNNNNELDVLKYYFIKNAKILFNKPSVIINSNYNYKHPSWHSFGVKAHNINFVTLSDHYAIQIDLQLKKKYNNLKDTSSICYSE
ncbi:conserved Plasmodium protein, unknown function [Plasmodium chabaudi chabaudi]|uniref:Endonuclease/exonuclease/phosphatase domain-containing protein n=1 Tax=Plasmodium chabaudi chabaudi TaxID=31271 RepID=A0A4V0K4F8_PLACU|nr:conserved Plasmodium protein, unknown function [Plasmodium chabaudi chabaudi]VTZ67290.1 conserved Plasmodium protein, unknown function [Plasmodium chabaudi chabaudi]|eukprot:XP_745835.2 conserved Plasmodium protein, unknown function [Plasmodium chabaudi chabaudi]